MPLTVETFAEGGRNPTRVEATRVLVRDAHGNAILFAAEYGDNLTLCGTVNDPDFDRLLETVGAAAVVVLRRFEVGE